jgi:DNA-binding transcriptional LysR family regulator
MKLDYRRLRAALQVAEELSFSRAAEHLAISQPALSGQIRALETDLGFPLFTRSTRRVMLTDNGRRFVEEVRPLVEESRRLERVLRAMGRQERTQLLLGAAIYTIDIPERVHFLDALVESVPEVDVEIETGVVQPRILAELYAGHLDLALLLGLPVPSEDYARASHEQGGRESLYDAGLRTAVLDRCPVRLLVPEESPLAALESISPGDLRGTPVVIFHRDHGGALYDPLAEYLRGGGAELVRPPEPNAIGVERHGSRARLPAVTLGWFPAPADRRMVSRPLAGLALETDLVLVGHPDVSTPAVERAFTLATDLRARTATG